MTHYPEPFPIIPLLPYQREDVESNDRFRWNCWARQTGKSFTKSLRRLLRGLLRRRTQILLSAGERQSHELMLKVRRHCQALAIAADYREIPCFLGMSVRRLEITLPGGVRIIGLPANPHTARGFTGDVLLDEFAMHVDDREIWAALLPTVLRDNGELDIASTPRGRGNMFDRLRTNDLFVHTTLTLPQAVAGGLNVDIHTMRTAMNDEELFRQEFLCEFLDESTAFLTYQQITACTDPSLLAARDVDELADDPRPLYAGVDIGRRHDLTAVWVLAPGPPSPHPEHAPLPNETAAWHHPGPPTWHTVAVFTLANAPFREQFDLLCRMMALKNLRRLCIDAGGLGMQLGEQLLERFGARRVHPVTLTAPLKSHVAGHLRIAVEARRILIPADASIINDWHSVERTVTPTGHFRLAAPRSEGAHADRFWAAALALHAADEAYDTTARPEFTMAAPRLFTRAAPY